MTRTNYYAGYYLIYDTHANSIYVGTSMNLFRRFTEHKYALQCNTHKNTNLQQSWNTAFSKKDSQVKLDSFFPGLNLESFDLLKNPYEQNQAVARFVFIPLVQIKLEPNLSQKEKALIKAELEEHEQAICELLTTELNLSSFNIWLTPGTDRSEAPNEKVLWFVNTRLQEP